MPINTTHQDYAERKAQWQRMRDAVAGQDAVHKGGTAYLPRLTEQTDEEYKAYKCRTPWYGATGRTLDGLIGMVFRTPPMLDAPEPMKVFAKDITLSGITLDGLARDTLQEVMTTARYGLLVEFPAVSEQPASLAAATERNLRPYITAYKAENILNWRIERVNNRMQPTLVVLSEQYEEQVDEFESTCKTQYRALMLEGGVYVQKLYRETTAGTGRWELFGEVVPQMGGQQLREIPFYPFGPDALSLQMQQSPMLDLADINLSHYRTAADLEHGAHFTGLPTPFIAGIQLAPGEKVKVGSSEAIVIPDPAGSAGYMEFTGQGLGALEGLMDRKEKQMAALGARMLAPEKAGIEASDTLAQRHNGENSVLAGIVQLVAYGFTEMLSFMARWAGINGEVTYTMNTDYLPRGMSAQDLTALVSSWQQGAISYQTLFANLQRGEIIAADVNAEDEEAMTKDQGPTMSAPTFPAE